MTIWTHGRTNIVVISGVAAIWTFWLYQRAAESDGTATVGLKQYIVENILNFQKYSEYKVFRIF